MDLSKELIQQFIDVTSQDKEVQNGVTLYGTIKTQGSEKFVILDGSDQLTPIKATTFVSDGERVTVMIKNHQAIVTGNLTSPAARQPDIEDTVGDKITEYDVIITKTIEAQNAKIGDLVAQNIEITGDLTAVNGTIEQLKSENVEITGKLDANEAEIKKLKTDKLDAETADIKFATVEDLKATNIEVNTIKGNHADFADLTTQNFEAVNANIENLEVNKLSASEADLKYANIDFANIGKAAIENLFAQSGLIKDLVVGDQHITGELVGVTIKGDLIEGGTIIADKLVVKGSDGLYYKLNMSGTTVESEQTEYNSLNGSIITAKSITATKVNVDDLVAFDATIGGFKITDNSIHSGVKSSVDNTTRGIYLDNTGQVAFGDGNSFLKYFKDSDGKWKLVVSANSVKLSTSDTTVEDALDDMNNKIDNTPKSVEEHFTVSSNPTTVPTSGWSTTPPVWQNGKYIWSKMVTTYVDGRISESKPVCITGAKGQDGTSGSAGKGIKSVTNYYLATNVNTGVTDTTSGWTTSIQTITATKKYLWNYEKITYTDNTTTKTTPVIIGVYGDKGQNGANGADGQAGADGVGIKSITEKYAVSTSNTTAPTSWHDTVQTMTTTNKYLWNYEIVTYTNNTTSETSKRVIGVYGDKGQTGATGSTGATGPQGPAGKGVKSITNYYLVSTASSGVTTSTSGWSTTVQNMTATNRYLWNYEKVTYTDNSTTTTTPVVIGVYGDKGNTGATGATGPTGPTGATGNGIKTITEYYLISANKTGVTTSTAGWSTTIPTLTATNKYLWNYEKITYTNGSSSTGSPKIIGVYGDKGQTGATGPTGPTGPAGVGIKSVDVEYYLSTSSTTQSGGSWSTTAPAWVNGKYMWSRTKTVTTDGTTKYSSPACITGQKGSTGATGNTGATGATGPTGATGQGVQSITEEYYLSTSKTSQSGGSWVTKPPTWSTGKYMWTRSKIVYKNPTATAYTTPVCDSSWEAVNEIEVGGTNLTTETNKGVTGWGWGMQTGGKTISEVTENGIRCCKMVRDSVAATGWSYISYNKIGRNKYLPNKKYTVSFEVKASVVTSFYVGLKEGDGLNPLSGDVKTGNTVANTWTKLSATITTLSSLPSSTSQVLYLNSMNSGTGVTYIFRNLKIETGNKATDWTPAPEDIEQRVSTTELELKPDKILQKVNTQIGAGGKIDTTSTILDKTGFTVKNGALKVQNKAGQNVLVGDTNGNLWIQNTVKVGGGTNGAIEMFNAKSSRVGLINQTGVYLNDGLFNVTSGAITQSGVGSNPDGIEKKTAINSDKMICKEVEKAGSQTLVYQGEHGTFETSFTMDFLEHATGTFDRTRLSATNLTIYHGEGTSDYDKGTKTIINHQSVTTTNVETRKINCTSMIKTLGFECSQGISVKNSNYQAADSQYIKMLRSNGKDGARLTSSDSGLGLRLHLYNNNGAWATHYMFKENGRFSTPGLEVRGTTIDIGKEGDNSSFVAFYDTTKTRRGYVGKGGNSSNNIYLYSESSDGNITINSGNNYVYVKGHLTPLWDNTYYLGTTSPGYRWKQVCATTTSIATSDSRYKKNIKPILGDNNVILLQESSMFDIELPDSDQAVLRDYHEFIKNRFQPYSYEYLTEDDELDDKQGFKLVDKEKMAKSIGFIADEYDLENDKVAKEFIFRTEDGMLNYNTGNYTTVIAIALQEEIRLRDNQIELLHDDIKQKDKKINDLEERLSKLESLINNMINKEE